MKISYIFWTDRDISKIRKVLNSAYHEEQAVEVSRKSANFSFANVKGIKEEEETGMSVHVIVEDWK